jgi:hypothetical protein
MRNDACISVSAGLDPTSASQLDSQLHSIHREPLFSPSMPDKDLRLLALDGGRLCGLSAQPRVKSFGNIVRPRLTGSITRY